MKEELEIKVECGHSSNVRVFYFPPPTPEIADSTLWVPDIIEKSQFKSILEGIKSPKLLEIAIYNLGEFCFEVIKRIIEELGEKIQELYLKRWALEKARLLEIEKKDEISWQELEPQVVKIIREVWEEQKKNT